MISIHLRGFAEAVHKTRLSTWTPDDLRRSGSLLRGGTSAISRLSVMSCL